MLATRQSELTRSHMAMRRPLGSAIFAQEVRVDGPEAEARDPSTRMGQVVPRLRHAPFSAAVGVRAWLPVG